MTRDPRTPADQLLSQLRSCLDAATGQPGLVKASVYQTEGYLRGVQGLSWEATAATAPSREDSAASFLHDLRTGAVPLRGRVKKQSQEYLVAFEAGLIETFPGAKGKPIASSTPRIWVRWLDAFPGAENPAEFSRRTGERIGEILKREYEEGLAGNLAAFLMDRRLHLDGVRDLLKMRGWLLGAIEHLRRDADPFRREMAEILNSNFSSIVLRAQHNAGPGYAAAAVENLSAMIRNLDQAIANLERTEPEASFYLKKNRATVITRALHSGALDYASSAAEHLPNAVKSLNRRIDALESSSPETASDLRSSKRALLYRALTNGNFKTFGSKS